MPRAGREFEKAVFAFIKALDPSAKVIFDHEVLDRDTGTPRQCDVWVNAKLGGHWPLSILVSCKDQTRKLDIGDIGTFCDEIRSTGASTGVIYSSSGFTEPALKKAKANGVACCRLYRDEPPDVPASIWFEQFTCTQSIKLVLNTDVVSLALKTWNDLFDLSLKEDVDRTVLDVVAEAYIAGGDRAVTKCRESTEGRPGFPKDWSAKLTLVTSGSDQKLTIQVLGKWKKYRARLEASLVDGSYCFANGSFIGSQRSPWIDVKGEHPGNNWIEVTDTDFAPCSPTMLSILHHPDVKATLREKLGPGKLVKSE